jgi:peptidyl-prolyl cis-trans isomerase SurA
VIVPRPTEAARRAALVEAESVRAELVRGADFATVARRVSDDPGTREQGGDLGWFRREMMVREFADVAFNLRPGVVSPVVRTDFGYHLITVERIQPAEIKARHILIAPEITAQDLDAARARADSVAAQIAAGASVDSLARLYNESSEPRLVGPVDRSQLDSTFAQAFGDAQPGRIVGPFLASPDGSMRRARLVIAQVTDVQPARPFTFEEVREQIRQQIQQQRAIRNLLDSLRRRTYVDVRL